MAKVYSIWVHGPLGVGYYWPEAVGGHEGPHSRSGQARHSIADGASEGRIKTP